MVKWQIMCRPKNLGGLGIINTAVMNKCLIIKWWWKILTVDQGTMGLKLLKAKYFPNGSPLFASAVGGSQFWRDLVKVKDDFRAQVKFLVGNRTSIQFWLDWWHGDAPLAASFPILFSYCSNLQISISELSANNWDLGFRRALSPEELDQWQQLAALFPLLSEEADAVT